MFIESTERKEQCPTKEEDDDDSKGGGGGGGGSTTASLQAFFSPTSCIPLDTQSSCNDRRFLYYCTADKV